MGGVRMKVWGLAVPLKEFSPTLFSAPPCLPSSDGLLPVVPKLVWGFCDMDYLTFYWVPTLQALSFFCLVISYVIWTSTFQISKFCCHILSVIFSRAFCFLVSLCLTQFPFHLSSAVSKGTQDICMRSICLVSLE